MAFEAVSEWMKRPSTWVSGFACVLIGLVVYLPDESIVVADSEKVVEEQAVLPDPVDQEESVLVAAGGEPIAAGGAMDAGVDAFLPDLLERKPEVVMEPVAEPSAAMEERVAQVSEGAVSGGSMELDDDASGEGRSEGSFVDLVRILRTVPGTPLLLAGVEKVESEFVGVLRPEGEWGQLSDGEEKAAGLTRIDGSGAGPMVSKAGDGDEKAPGGTEKKDDATVAASAGQKMDQPLADDKKAASAEDKLPAVVATSKPTTRITPPAVPADEKSKTAGADPMAPGVKMDGSTKAEAGKAAASEVAKKAEENKPVTEPVLEKAEPPPPPPALSKVAEEALPTAPAGMQWKVHQIEGRAYVTGQSIQRFYGFAQHRLEKGNVWLQSPNLILKGRVGSQELLVNNIKFMLSYPVKNIGNESLFSQLDLCKLIEPVIRPNFISSNSTFDTVVLDAGHGGHDKGAKGVYGYEKDYALTMMYAVRDALMKRGLKVVLTRSGDSFLTLGERVAIANKTPNSVFISIHFNSGPSTATGIETFALTPQGSASSLARGGGFSNSAVRGNAFDSENIALATAVHAQVVHRYKFVDRGIKRARWNVLSGCQRPGILFEGGFVTNARECQLVASESYRKGVSDAIAEGVMNFRKALQPRMGQR